MEIGTLRDELRGIGQEQVLRHFDALDAAGKTRLAGQLRELDLSSIGELAETYVRNRPAAALPAKIQPVTPLPMRPDAERRSFYERAETRGRQLLSEGKAAAFLVAGGQGTRLGYDGPKGQFAVTPIKRKPLFQVFAEQILSQSRRGRAVPWYIMTGEANDAATRRFFAANAHFGLNPADVIFFTQGMMPAFGMDGQLLLETRDSLALSPDGHGGSLRALHKSGALADMRRRGVEHLSYFQVDNPLVHILDPLFLGLHDLTGSEMSSKTIAKANPLEKVGNFVVGDGKLQVIEYSDLPKELAVSKGPDGGPIFNAASIGIHALRVSFIERLNASGRLALPWHRAEKKVPCLDAAGNPVRPDKPNAVKLEQFVFDAIPLAADALVYQTERGEEFSPVKNADGDDSPATCRRDQIRRAARWLSEAGASVPMRDGDASEPDAVLEISPLYAENAGELGERMRPPVRIKSGENVYLG
jgi:UDP-N-acetylglucosamine/UDP-N-acetylgalactosamine diphosphorylase